MKTLFLLILTMFCVNVFAQDPIITSQGSKSDCFIWIYGPTGMVYESYNCNELTPLVDGNAATYIGFATLSNTAMEVEAGFGLVFNQPYTITEIGISGMIYFPNNTLYVSVTATDINGNSKGQCLYSDQIISVNWTDVKSISYDYFYSNDGSYNYPYFKIGGDLSVRGHTNLPKIYYGYNGGGYRTSRTILLPVAKKSAKVDASDYAQEKNKEYSENLNKAKITIYPNPTQGELKIDIADFDFEKKSAISIYNSNGNLITQKSPLSNSNSIDLSSAPVGMYLLKIKLGDDVSEWKVMKE